MDSTQENTGLKLSSGIYQIFNIYTSDCYIGSSININKRLQVHKRHLKSGKHHSIILQRAWNKYGSDSFEFRILKYINKENLITTEQLFIDCFNPVYNICKKAGSPLGIKHSKESSEKKRIYALSNEIKPPFCGKKVVMIHKDTDEEIACFKSITDACLFVNRDGRFVSTITEICNQSNPRRKTAYGYKWRWI